MILCCVVQYRYGRSTSLFLFALYSVFLFISFKAAFIRPFGHVLIASTSLVFASLFLPFSIKAKPALLVSVLCLSAALILDQRYASVNLFKNMKSNYTAALNGLYRRVSEPGWLRNNYLLTLEYLHQKNAFPNLPGSTDIYSYQQTDLLASGNKWSPRPIFQSYSVFNKVLSQANYMHLLSSNRPDFIFFKMQAIDNRLPPLEDSSSWSLLLNEYHPMKWVGDVLLLAKNRVHYYQRIKRIEIQGMLGLPVNIPFSSGLVYMHLQPLSSLWGRGLNFLYKRDEMYIDIGFENSSMKRFRFIPEMAEDELLLSPLIETTEEFSHLYVKNTLAYKRVKTVTLNSSSPAQWQRHFKVYFYQIKNLA